MKVIKHLKRRGIRRSHPMFKNHLLQLSAIFGGMSGGTLLFNGRCDFGSVRLLDNTFAVCAAIFLVHFVSTYTVYFSESDTFPVAERKSPGIFKTVFITLLVLTMFSGGWFLLDHSLDLYWMPRTAALLGAWLLGAGVTLVFIFSKQLWKGDKA